MAKTINPAMRKASYGVEGVVPIPGVAHIPFVGGMDLSRLKYQQKLGAFSDIQNMRPTRPGMEKRKGCRELNTSADGTKQIMSLHQFSKGSASEVHTFAQMWDATTGDITVKEFTNNPPTVGTTLGTVVHTSSAVDTSKSLPAGWATVGSFDKGDVLLYADGTSLPRIYPGVASLVGNFVVYKGTVEAPLMPENSALDYSINIKDSDATTYADISSMATTAEFDYIFIRTKCPAKQLTFTLVSGKENLNSSVVGMSYFNGAFTAVSDFVDNTITDGVAFSKSGSMTWTMTTDHRPHYMFGVTGYWYRIGLASGSTSADVKVSSCTYESDWMEIQNNWDGIPNNALEAYIYSANADTYSFYSAMSIDLGSLVSTNKVYFNAMYPIIGFYINVGYFPNTNASVLTVKYNNGAGFTAVANMADGTVLDGKTMAQNGWVTFDHPTDEQKINFRSSSYYSNWYELTFSATLAATMIIGITTMPYRDMAAFGNCSSVCAWKNRISYAFDSVPGYIVASGKDNPMELNGSSYFIYDVGDGRSNRIVAQAKFRNELMVWQEEKGVDGGCVTLLEGYSASTVGKLLLSAKYGTFSQKSVCVIEEAIPNRRAKEADSSIENTLTIVAYFLSRYGFCACDGRGGVDLLSYPDIDIYFDPTDDAHCIRRGYEKEHWIGHDSTHGIIRIGLVTGTTATTPNTFLVYDYKTDSWSHDSLAQPFSCHTEIECATGNYPVIQIAGGQADGKVYQTNYGTQDVATPIDSFVIMEFDGQGHTLHLEQMVLRIDGSCTVTPTADDVDHTAITVSA